MVKKYKFMTAAIIAAITAAAFTGCGMKEQKEFKNDDTVLSIKDTAKIDYATASTYSRLIESEAYSFISKSIKEQNGEMPKDIWNMRLDTKNPYKEDFKNENLAALKNMLLNDVHNEEYGVELTEEDLKVCDKAAEEFIKSNSQDALDAMHATKESVSNVIKLLATEMLVEDKIKDSIDKDINISEIAQSTFSYVEFNKKDYDDPEKEAKKFIKEAKKNAEEMDFDAFVNKEGVIAQNVSFTISAPEYEDYGKEMLRHAMDVEHNKYDYYKDSNGNVIVIYMRNKNDADATDLKKTKILDERKVKAYQEAVDSWDDEITVNKKAWNSINPSNKQIFKAKEDSAAAINVGDNSTEINITASDGGDVSATID